MPAALRALARRGIQSLLIEGGGHTLGQLFDARLANEIVFYIAPLLAGGHVPAVGGRGIALPSQAPTLVAPSYDLIGNCLRISGRISSPRA